MSIQTGEGRKQRPELFIMKHHARLLWPAMRNPRGDVPFSVRAVPYFEMKGLFANSSSAILISRIGTPAFSLPHHPPPPFPFVKSYYCHPPPPASYTWTRAWRLLVRSSVKMFAIKSCCSYMYRWLQMEREPWMPPATVSKLIIKCKKTYTHFHTQAQTHIKALHTTFKQITTHSGCVPHPLPLLFLLFSWGINVWDHLRSRWEWGGTAGVPCAPCVTAVRMDVEP